MSGRKLINRYGGVALLVVGIVGALAAASRLSSYLFERPNPARGAPGRTGTAEAPATDPRIFQVTSAVGRVDAYRDGRWIPIQEGALLTLQDIVRTAPGARAVLKLGSTAEIELREKVEIRLDRLSSAGASLDLRRGKVLARVSGARENLEITAAETRTANEGPAHFVVRAGEDGRVAVAATSGSARFASRGKEVRLTEGTQTYADVGKAPVDPQRIPEDVLLTVVWPTGERHTDSAPVEGQVGALSRLTINGRPAQAGADGKFTATVPLKMGANELQVEVEDLDGRKRVESTTVFRRPVRTPDLAPEAAQLWHR